MSLIIIMAQDEALRHCLEESLSASLSVALGLSMKFSQEPEEIRLDTMFVDEGFGSFNEESLE